MEIFAETAVSQAWMIVCDELVKIVREGGNTAWAMEFLHAGEQ